MKIAIEDIITEEFNQVLMLESATKTQDSECTYGAKVRTAKDTRARNKLIIACVICLVFMIGEIVGGICANSLAILSDSAHLFSDLSSFIVGLIAMYLSDLPHSRTMTFGWHRAEVLGALLSVLLIWVVTGILVYTAVMRVINNNFHIDSMVMLIMSGIAVFVNIIMAFVLHPHSHSHEPSSSHSHGHSHSSSDLSTESYEPLISPASDSLRINAVKKRPIRMKIQNINLRAAFVHVIGDIIQSLGVLIASLIIFFKPEWKIADPICTFLFSVLVVFTTVFIFIDIIGVLLERKPPHLSHNAISKQILAIPGVLRCHNLRLWSITLSKTAATCHILVDEPSRSKQVLDLVNQILQDDFHISEIAVQIETTGGESHQLPDQ